MGRWLNVDVRWGELEEHRIFHPFLLALILLYFSWHLSLMESGEKVSFFTNSLPCYVQKCWAFWQCFWQSGKSLFFSLNSIKERHHGEKRRLLAAANWKRTKKIRRKNNFGLFVSGSLLLFFFCSNGNVCPVPGLNQGIKLLFNQTSTWTLSLHVMENVVGSQTSTEQWPATLQHDPTVPNMTRRSWKELETQPNTLGHDPALPNTAGNTEG